MNRMHRSTLTNPLEGSWDHRQTSHHTANSFLELDEQLEFTPSDGGLAVSLALAEGPAVVLGGGTMGLFEGQTDRHRFRALATVHHAPGLKILHLVVRRTALAAGPGMTDDDTGTVVAQAVIGH